MTTLQNLTADQLRKAISIKEQIENLQAQLASIGDGSVAASVPTKSRGKHKRSPAARTAMAAAQKRRWAKLKGASDGALPKRRKMSAAGRAKIAAAAKARWAKVKAAGKNRL